MSLTMKNEGGDYTPAPAGNHMSICTGVIDLGTQHNDAFTYDNKSIPASDKPQVLITWELPLELIDIEGEQKPAGISNFYNASFNEKAKLRQHLESWRGVEFSEEELCGFDIANVLGKPCMLNIIHNDKGRAKITSVSGIPKGMNVPEMVAKPIHFDFDNYDQTVFDSISEGIQGIIKKSPEYQALNDAGTNESPGYGESPDFTDDDIPF